jgi:hypothetical protein
LDDAGWNPNFWWQSNCRPRNQTVKRLTYNMEAIREQNIIGQYFNWQFFDMPGNILKAWKNFLKFNLNYFSVPLLLKTFFSPWRGYRWGYPKGLDFGKYFEAFISNLISRILGAILRFFLIITGLLLEIFIFFGGIIIFLGWLILPSLLIAGLLFGIKIIL